MTKVTFERLLGHSAAEWPAMNHGGGGGRNRANREAPACAESVLLQKTTCKLVARGANRRFALITAPGARLCAERRARCGLSGGGDAGKTNESPALVSVGELRAERPNLSLSKSARPKSVRLKQGLSERV